MKLNVRQTTEPRIDMVRTSAQMQEIERNTPRFHEVIKTRRQDLNLTQLQVAQGVGVQSPEFIGMLEKGAHIPGGRRLDLNKVPRLADTLQLNRKDLVRLALFEVAPVAAITLFGDQTDLYQVCKADVVKDITNQQAKILSRLESLPADIRSDILTTIKDCAEMYAATA